MTSSSVSLIIGYTAAFSSSLVNSAGYVVVRQAGDTMHPLQWMLLYSGLGFFVSLPLYIQLAPNDLKWAQLLPSLLAVAVAGIVAQTLIGYGQMVTGCRAGITALLSSSEMVWSYGLQVTVLGQPATATTLSGAALILIAISLPIIEMEVHRRRSDATLIAGGTGSAAQVAAEAEDPETESLPLLSVDR
jgi:drug/metabolite transporter (DMT)-like permease